MVFVNGCNSQMKDLETRNRIQADRIRELEGQLQAAQLKLAEVQRQLDAINATGGVEVDALRQKIAALEKEIGEKEALIKSMQDKLMGISPLPVELNTALEDFARGNDMVEYDASRGLVKFKSDLLFEKGSDDVTSTAAEAVKTLCGILNTETAKQFHIIVAGHTDDLPIQRPQTRVEHPTNRHLSSHRAIAVVEVMEKSGIEQTRLSTRGFGEYRPLEPNAPNKRGNPKNRRVEIYIVPAGA
jgi:chemotaxis protein MotB